MTVINERWINHIERIAENWCQVVRAEDVVLLSGDTSWGNSLNRVRPDLEWLTELPGRKVLVRGNHDRWWVNIKRVRRQVLPEGFFAIEGDTLEIDGVLLCGAQGHITPDDPLYHPDPPKNRFERELKTLKSALKAAARKRELGQHLIIMMHYPPFTSEGKPTMYSELIEQLAPAQCLYAHLHRESEWEVAVQGERNGINYCLVAADYLNMRLQQVYP